MKRKIKLFFAHLFILFCFKDLAEALNTSSSSEELDEKILKLAGFKT